MSIKVTKKEVEILNALWQTKVSQTATMICENNPHLNYSTVQSSLKKLIGKKLIKIEEIVYSGTVLTRSYAPTISKEEFILDQYSDIKISNLVSHFLKNSDKEETNLEISKIKAMLENRKK
ncbi:BlaI/MecI/CopY family transcriptional regulator [uncultured Vagococcus sp.]|uniref:BlaI/MecI/CopY family transcriptional regulator n=1 Tax=uncultured Vagococcus sp. TaxID=189676 RepID=UPI0028D415C6|nr:BlaI/MecI/CopY family transcriptional regulator [uncultured Vagococcus sp.]